jgi:hypothetical protein
LTVKFMSDPGRPFGQPFGVARAIPENTSVTRHIPCPIEIGTGIE